MKSVLVVLTFIAIVSGASYTLAKLVFPPSVEVYFAAVAGCDISDKELQRDNSQFESIKWWERILTHVYRFEQLTMDKPYTLDDSLTKNSSVYHILLVASDNTYGICDNMIFSLMDVYIEKDAPIDHFDEMGLTPLQLAVVTENHRAIEVLVRGGADIHIRNRRKNSPISELGALEIARLFVANNPSDSSKLSVLRAIESEM